MAQLAVLLAGFLLIAESQASDVVEADPSTVQGFLSKQQFSSKQAFDAANYNKFILPAVSNVKPEMGANSFTIIDDKPSHQPKPEISSKDFVVQKSVQKLRTTETLSVIGVGLLALVTILGARIRRGLQPATIFTGSSTPGFDVTVSTAPGSTDHITEMRSQSPGVGWGQQSSLNSGPLTLCYAKRRSTRLASSKQPVADPPTLEEQLELAEGENAFLRRRIAKMESRLREQPHPPLWALEDWASIDGIESCRELGRDRLGTALELYNAAHPKKTPLRTDGSLEQLAQEVVEVLPALKQSVMAKRRHAQSKRVLQAATKSGHIKPGHVVEGVVAVVREIGVLIDIPTPFGTYRAQLQPAEITGVSNHPLQSFVAEALPVGSHILAEVLDVDVSSEITACHLSTKILEEALGEMSTDRTALFERARARHAAQPPPLARAERHEIARQAEQGLAEPYIEALEHHNIRAD